MKQIKCNRNNYGMKRARGDVKFIVIHNTGNIGDTAEGNGRYFASAHKPATSAHFFIDRNGNIIKSVPLNYTAYSVGGKSWGNKGGKYYKICTNSNSVSIELCDIYNKDPSQKQINATVKCVKYIMKYCKNARYLIRHYDVNGKTCPYRFTDETDAGRARWIKLKAEVYKNAGMGTK